MALLNDRTLDFVRHGYRFQQKVRDDSMDAAADRRVGVRMFGRNALLVRGLEGVKLFYDTTKVKRAGAMPSIIGGGLFGKGSVHGLDDDQHRTRKATFVRAAMDPEAIDAMLERCRDQWGLVLDGWKDGTSAYDAAVDVYGRSAQRWAGFHDDEETLTDISRKEGQIVDGFAVAGPAHVLEMVRRRQCDTWFRNKVKAARSGALEVDPATPFGQILAHRDSDGSPLSDQIAAVEVQNLFRPTIAVARFAAFLALALENHPEWREKIRAEALERRTTIGGDHAIAFAEEVRRFYPFVPLLPALARTDFEFEGMRVRKGDRVGLDFYGTMRDPAHWEDPETFDPTRFLPGGMRDSEVFIPQGGGDPHTGHRCPGEPIAVGILAITAAELSLRDYRVPPQDLSYPMDRVPTMPRSGVKLEGMSASAL